MDRWVWELGPIAAVCGLAAVTYGWLAAAVVAAAYLLGRMAEQRTWMAHERARMIDGLEAWTSWAEEALACAPEELPADQEEARARLQADYQAARSALEKLRR